MSLNFSTAARPGAQDRRVREREKLRLTFVEGGELHAMDVRLANARGRSRCVARDRQLVCASGQRAEQHAILARLRTACKDEVL